MTADRNDRLAKPSRRLLAIFHSYLRWYIGRHFHGVRLANEDRFPRVISGPTVIYLNHPSWWDPLTCILLARRFLPQVDHYAPMDEAALRQYKFFARLGVFPVELDTARGAIQFLRASGQVLSQSNSLLWLTPQGHFVDVRKRPVLLKDGLSVLLSRFPQATVFPLAVEYVYWDERLPEILINSGAPIRIDDAGASVAGNWHSALVTALGTAQEELADLSMTRDASRFETILDGRAGIGAFYDLWRRGSSGARGERYHPDHGSIPRS